MCLLTGIVGYLMYMPVCTIRVYYTDWFILLLNSILIISSLPRVCRLPPPTHFTSFPLSPSCVQATSPHPFSTDWFTLLCLNSFPLSLVCAGYLPPPIRPSQLAQRLLQQGKYERLNEESGEVQEIEMEVDEAEPEVNTVTTISLDACLIAFSFLHLNVIDYNYCPLLGCFPPVVLGYFRNFIWWYPHCVTICIIIFGSFFSWRSLPI